MFTLISEHKKEEHICQCHLDNDIRSRILKRLVNEQSLSIVFSLFYYNKAKKIVQQIDRWLHLPEKWYIILED